MGLSNFPSAAEGVLPAIVMNTVLSVVLLKNMFRSLLQLVGVTASIAHSSYSPNLDQDSEEGTSSSSASLRERRVSITQYKLLCHNHKMGRSPSSSYGVERCCVCLCGFEANEEVSELSCKHFFHRGCLDKWFLNNHTTCPLCRSIV